MPTSPGARRVIAEVGAAGPRFGAAPRTLPILSLGPVNFRTRVGRGFVVSLVEPMADLLRSHPPRPRERRGRSSGYTPG